MMFSPSKTMRPALARGELNNVIIKVDLPAPLAPISVTISPVPTERSRFFKAWICP